MLGVLDGGLGLLGGAAGDLGGLGPGGLPALVGGHQVGFQPGVLIVGLLLAAGQQLGDLVGGRLPSGGDLCQRRLLGPRELGDLLGGQPLGLGAALLSLGERGVHDRPSLSLGLAHQPLPLPLSGLQQGRGVGSGRLQFGRGLLAEQGAQPFEVGGGRLPALVEQSLGLVGQLGAVRASLGADRRRFSVGRGDDLGRLSLGRRQHAASVSAQPAEVGGAGRGLCQFKLVARLARLGRLPGELRLQFPDVRVHGSALVATQGLGEVAGRGGGLVEQVETSLIEG